MDLNRNLERVKDAKSLARFLGELAQDPITREVGSVHELLERVQAFLVDTSEDDAYLQRYANLPGRSWRLLGDVLFSGFIYE